MDDHKQVDLLGIDAYSGDSFVLYFSDDTYVKVSAAEIVACFPNREPVPDSPDDPLPPTL